MAILDASGLLWEELRTEQAGIDWVAYREAGVVGYAVALVSMLFLTVLMKIVFVEGRGKPITLSDAKDLVAGRIEQNPGFYRHAPPDALTARLRRARTFHELISNIYRD